MPNELRCPQCHKLLSTDAKEAGQPMRCPHCGAAESVQGQPAAAQGASPTGTSRDNAPAASSVGEPLAAPTVSDNPYASPPSPPQPSLELPANAGPPWERERASLASLFATAREMLFSPSHFFSQMRGVARPWRPLTFAMWGSTVGIALWMASWLAFTVISLALQHKLPIERMATADPRGLGEMQGRMCCDFCGSGLLIALAIAVHTTLSSALMHAELLMFGAAKYSYQTTFRIVAYAVGGTMLVSALPLCGLYIAVPIQPIYIGISLKHGQEIPTGTAVVTVLLPILLCGGGLALLLVETASGFG